MNPRILVAALVAGTLLTAGCAGLSHTGAADGKGGLEDLVEVEPAALDELDAATEHLDAGRREQAREALLGLEAKYPDAPVAARASLYLGVLDLQAGHHAAAADRLLPLGRESAGEPALRHAALPYFVAARAQLGAAERTEALEVLGNHYDGVRPSPLVRPSERAAAMILVYEARALRGEYAEALEALSWAFQLGSEAEREYSLGRGMELTRSDLDAAVLRDCADDTDDYMRGLCGAALVLAAAESGTLGPDVEARAGEVQVALSRIGAQNLADRVAEAITRPAQRAPMRVGAVLPLSGSAKQVGERALGGILLAERAFRSKAPRLTTLVEDSGSSPEGAAQAVARLAEQGVDIIVGPLANDEARAAALAAEEVGVPIILLSFDRDVVAVGPNVFRRFVNIDAEVDTLVEAARARGKRRLAVAYPDRPFGRTMVAKVRHAAERSGLELAVEVAYDPARRDFQTVARKVRRSNADAVFIPDTGARVSMIAPFLAAEGLWCSGQGSTGSDDAEERRAILCLGSGTWAGSRLFRDGGSYLQGALVAASYATSVETKANHRFVRDHKKLLESEPDLFSAYAFEAAKLAHSLVVDARAGKALGASIRQPRDGLTGKVTCSEDGDLAVSPVLLIVDGSAMRAAEGLAE